VKKIGLFFGSFNPIHVGHLAIAEYMLQTLSLDSILFIVSPQNPFKSLKDLWSEHKRFMLVQKAVEYNSKFIASDIEFKLPKPSYTFLTLEKLKQRYPQAKFYIIIGSDNLTRLMEWKQIDEILQQHSIEIYQRPGTENLTSLHPNIHIHSTPMLSVSSTEIRNLLAAGKSVKGLMPESILHLLQ